MNKSCVSKSGGERGAVLVITLLLIVVLAVATVAFMQNTSTDRQTARSIGNHYRAQLAAESGVEVARARLAQLISGRPHHSIGYFASGQTAYPVFYGADEYNAQPEQFFLVSTPTLEASAELPFPLDDNSVDINAIGEPATSAGWLGTATVKNLESGAWVQSRPLARVPWVYLLADDSKPNQPDPKTANYNPYIARYAFWVEDETSKLDVTLVGNADANGAFQRVMDFQKAADDPLALPRQLDLGALPLQDQEPLPAAGGGSQLNAAILQHMQMAKDITAEHRALAFFDGVTFEDVRFHATTVSKSNELAGSGKRRVNLNALVSDTESADAIAAQLDDIIFVITGKHVFRDAGLHDTRAGGARFSDVDGEGPMPDFGRRFYTEPELSTGDQLRDNHGDVYMVKLAANIRDYIDADSQPTFVDAEGEVISGPGPKPWQIKEDDQVPRSWLPGQEPIALGKEAVPYLQENAWHARFLSIQKIGTTANRIVSFTLDHYLEFYNPSTKDWVAPENAKISLSNFPEFDAGDTYPPVPIEDIDLDISGVVFPAGTVVVVTTCPNVEEQPPGLIADGAKVVRPGDGLRTTPNEVEVFREFNDIVCRWGSSSPVSRGLRLRGRTGSADYETRMVLSTPQGVVGAFPALSLAAGTAGGSPFEMSLSADEKSGTWLLPEDERLNRRFVFVSSLRGNDALSRSGDPRSLNEQLKLEIQSSAWGDDVTRFYQGYAGNEHAAGGLPRDSTLGIPGIKFVITANWPDYHVPLSNIGETAYAVVADAPMKSIGELGHIYDPHRKLGDAKGSDQDRIRLARGGGRTLKFGQPDDLVGGVAAIRFTPPTGDSVGWFNGAWRLADIFSAEPGRSAGDVESPPTARGKININGVLRDGGTAFRAALRAFTFSPALAGDTGRAGKALTESEIDELIKQLETYLRNRGPMMCRGELSQLAFFQAAGAQGTAGGQPSSITIDRGREEIFRRVVELITTRSLSFKVFSVGQALRQNPNGDISVSSTVRQEASLEFEPQIGSGINEKVTGYDSEITRRMDM